MIGQVWKTLFFQKHTKLIVINFIAKNTLKNLSRYILCNFNVPRTFNVFFQSLD